MPYFLGRYSVLYYNIKRQVLYLIFKDYLSVNEVLLKVLSLHVFT